MERPYDYVFDGAFECERLERQALLQGIEGQLRHFHVPAGARVLDAGCGSGVMSRLLASHHPESEVVGVDQNPRYVSFATERAAPEGLANLSFESADIRKLPFETASFDVVCSQNVLFYIADQQAALQEFRRVLKPGGQLVISLRHQTLLTNVPEDPALQRRLERVIYSLADILLARRLPLMYRDAGFEDVTVDIETDHIYTAIGSIDRERRRNVAELMGAAMTRIADLLGGQIQAEAFLADLLAYLDRPDTCTYTTLWVVSGTAPAA
jgi:SAM-dependent methyltransferase